MYLYKHLMRLSFSVRSPSSFSTIFINYWTVNYLFIFGLFLIFCAFSPNRNVDMVYGRCISCGEQVTIRVVLEFPPKESFNIFVSLESRYGTWPYFFPLYESALITFPKLVRLKFIFFASSKTFPSAPVFDIFSDPAKSIKNSLLVFEAPSGMMV